MSRRRCSAARSARGRPTSRWSPNARDTGSRGLGPRAGERSSATYGRIEARSGRLPPLPAWWSEPAGDGLSAERGGLADGVFGETRLVLDRLDELFGATEGADEQEAKLLLTAVVATG